MLMIYTDEADPAADGPQAGSAADASQAGSALMAEYAKFTSEMVERGLIRGGERLRPTADATTVRVRDGDLLISDGPFAETKEQIGGYYVIECADLDSAIEVAARIPSARHGTIEVRPIWET
jgi:hypothetical protein